MAYKSTRRQWVKLWVNEWLDGTTRFELTTPQRLMWVDLLALAGRSRFPGFIYAGIGENGKRVGYPIPYLAGVLQMDEIAANNSLKLLADKGHITLEESAPEQYIIGIVNWDKYQSEYLRQKAYRKVTPKVTTDSTSRLPVEVEVEVDGEVEVEVERRSQKSLAPLEVARAPEGFLLFMETYPEDHRGVKSEALIAWTGIPSAELHMGEILSGVETWKSSSRWSEDGGRYIPSACRFLKAKQWRTNPPGQGDKEESKKFIERMDKRRKQYGVR